MSKIITGNKTAEDLVREHLSKLRSEQEKPKNKQRKKSPL